ncbi:MAG: BamA/TamA family outer membrane protein [Burkholderiaceae bacterium]|nr:BamA/TamA family outer membrane protein [Burkholderiaceae bacterium]
MRTSRVAPAALRALACALALCAAPSWAQRANYEIEVEAPEELRAPLRTLTLLGRWRTDPDFEPEQLELFIDRARDESLAIARAAGFFSAAVEVARIDALDARDQRRGSGVPVIRIEVDAGARTTVNALRFELEGEARDADMGPALLSRWPLGEGTFFRSTEWELGKRQLIEQLHQRGYLRARITRSEASVDPERTTASLSIALDSGPRLRFGALAVRGLERYPRSIVDALAPWNDGDPYAFEQLLRFQERVRSEVYFTGATVLPDLDAVELDPARLTVPIAIDVREREAQRLTSGLGFSTDHGARALLGYEHRNLRDRGWQLDTGVLLESVRRQVFANGRTPWDRSGHRWQTGARYERQDISGELTDKNTVYFGQARRSDEIEHFVSLQYQTEQRGIDMASGSIRDSRRALSAGYAWNLRRIDSRIDPRDGYTLSAQLSGATKHLLSDRSFTRLYGRAMRFWPMPGDSALGGGLLVGMLEAGWVIAGSRDDIPSENLFRAGGAQSLRGYDFLSLGVREGEAIVGGRVMAIASIEYQHPITAGWYGAGFVDAGNAADTWGQWKAVYGIGVGVRWRSPVGPINLDLAYGTEARRFRLHFSVGYSF